MKIALVENANTQNIRVVSDGNYRLTLPDGSSVSPVFAGWVGENYMLVGINFDLPIPTFLSSVNIGSNTGTGYTVDDVLTITGDAAQPAQIQVSVVGSNGIVTGVIVSNTGQYTSNITISDNEPTGGTGTNLKVDPTMEKFRVESKSYVYDSNAGKVDETNTYETPEIDNTSSIEQQRQSSLEADSGNQNLKDKLRTATSAQIDTWLLNNVTNLAEARSVLGAIMKFLANKFSHGKQL